MIVIDLSDIIAIFIILLIIIISIIMVIIETIKQIGKKIAMSVKIMSYMMFVVAEMGVDINA